MAHPTDGVLRRLLDEPAGVADTDREHVDTCAQCREELAGARQDAALVDAALMTDVGADIDLRAAWDRLTTAAAAPGMLHAVGPPPAGRARKALRRPATAALAVAVVVAGATTAAANDWLPIFRTEEVAPVGFTSTDLLALPDLREYGHLEVTDEPDVHEVSDAAAAEAASGLDVAEVADLPRGIVGEPTYRVGDHVRATFTFSDDRAARAAADAGEPLPPPPPGLDGAQVRLEAGPGVAQVWMTAAGAPGLVVGRAVAPTASSSGLPFNDVRDYLLSLPWLPEDVAVQLRTFTADGTTLPLPVPAGRATTRSAEVHGVPATVVASRDRSFAAVVWVEDGLVNVVAGSLDDDEVLAVARSAR